MHLLKNFNKWWNDRYDDYWMYRRKQGLLEDIKRTHGRICLTRDQKAAVDDFYMKNYGAKIPYFWHERYMSFTGNFEKQYFPVSLYFSEFEHYQNNRSEYAGVLQNKKFLNFVIKGMGICIPKTIFSCTDGVHCGKQSVQQSDLNEISNIGRVFIKPAKDSCQGKGCMMLDVRGGVDQISGRMLKDILDGYKDNFIVQERIETLETVSLLHPNSVNTFRIATYRWKDQFYHCPVVMRIGRGWANIDNASSGGIYVAVNDNGTLQEKAFCHEGEKFYSHPDTGVRFDGYRIDEVPQLIQTALKCHSNLSELGSINWDFTIGRNGEPILIEANVNSGGAVQLAQNSHGTAFFGDRTAEILCWLKFMRKIPLSKREPYLFGYGVD